MDNFRDNQYLITDAHRDLIKLLTRGTREAKIIWSMYHSCRSYFTITHSTKISVTASDFGGNAEIVFTIESRNGVQYLFADQVIATLQNGKMKKGTTELTADQSEKDFVLFTALYSVAFYNSLKKSEQIKQIALTELSKEINLILI